MPTDETAATTTAPARVFQLDPGTFDRGTYTLTGPPDYTPREVTVDPAGVALVPAAAVPAFLATWPNATDITPDD